VSPSTSLHRRPLSVPIAVTLSVILASSLLVAHAASIGLAAKRLGSFAIANAPTAPTVYAWTAFTAANNTDLNGLALPSGQTWTVHIGTWRINTNQAATTVSTALSNASVAVGTVNAAVQITMIFGATARRAGVTFLDDGTNGMYVVYSNQNGGQLQMYKYQGGATLLATTTNVGTPASATLRVETFTNTINVYFAGTLVMTYTLTAAEATLFKAAAHDRFGIIADSDTNTKFDDYRVESQ
jgi:hypothetical protein